MSGNEHGSGRGMRILRVLGMVLAGTAFAVILALVFGLVVEYLWNWLMPEIFGLKAISYWQAFGIIILAKIFFGSFGRHPGGHGHDRGPWNGRGHFHRQGCRGSRSRKYFDRYWEEGGRAAFEEYVRKIETEKKDAG